MTEERAQHEAMLDASVQLVLAAGAPAALEGDAGAWFASQGVAASDATQLAELGARRLLVYRRHVRRGLHRAVLQEIPRTAARLGDAFAPWVDRWIEDVGPRSHYLRDLAFELVAWALPRWRDDASVPGYIADLARHELLYFDVASSAGLDSASDAEEITLERGLRFARSVRLARYEHAVHLLSEDVDARDLPLATPTALLAYRDAEHAVRFLQLTPLAAAILERLLPMPAKLGDSSMRTEREALGPAVQGACAALGVALDASVTSSTAALVEDLLARGAVLGGQAC